MRSTWVDFKVLKRVVSIEKVITYYGLTLRRVHGPYLRGRCPLPTHVSKGSVQSFIVNTDKNVWACHSDSCAASRGWRRGGNVLDFVAAMERCSIRDAALKLQERFSVAPVSSEQIVAATGGDETYPPAAAKENNQPLAFQLFAVDSAHPYLAQRRVDRNTAAHFGIARWKVGSSSPSTTTPEPWWLTLEGASDKANRGTSFRFVSASRS